MCVILLGRSQSLQVFCSAVLLAPSRPTLLQGIRTPPNLGVGLRQRTAAALLLVRLGFPSRACFQSDPAVGRMCTCIAVVVFRSSKKILCSSRSRGISRPRRCGLVAKALEGGPKACCGMNDNEGEGEGERERERKKGRGKLERTEFAHDGRLSQPQRKSSKSWNTSLPSRDNTRLCSSRQAQALEISRVLPTAAGTGHELRAWWCAPHFVFCQGWHVF